jgi:hypothetical protein
MPAPSRSGPLNLLADGGLLDKRRWADAWSGVGHFFTGLTAAGLTGLLVALAVLLLAGGHATIRGTTV